MTYDIHETRRLLASYGPDSAKWPDPQAARAALKRHSVALAHELSAARSLEARLAPALSAPPPAPSELLPRRILKNLPAQEAPAPKNVPANDSAPLPWRRIAAMFIALAAAGFAVMSLNTPAEETAPTLLIAEDGTQETETQVWREAALDMGVEDIFEWVYAE